MTWKKTAHTFLLKLPHLSIRMPKGTPLARPYTVLTSPQLTHHHHHTQFSQPLRPEEHVHVKLERGPIVLIIAWENAIMTDATGSLACH